MILDLAAYEYGLSQVAVQHQIPQPAQVLDVNRDIESEFPLKLFSQLLPVFLAREVHLAHQDVNGVSGYEPNGERGQEDDYKKGGYG